MDLFSNAGFSSQTEDPAQSCLGELYGTDIINE